MSTKSKEKVIVIGVINDEGSEYAFDFYVNHFHKPENRLIIVNVIEPTIVSSNQLSLTTVVKRVQQQSEEKEIIEYIRDKYECKVQNNYIKAKINVISYSRNPGKVLAEVAEEEGACMVVIGRRYPFKFQDQPLSQEAAFEYLLKKTGFPIVYAFRPDEVANEETSVSESESVGSKAQRKISLEQSEKFRRISCPAMTATQRNQIEMTAIFNSHVNLEDKTRRHSHITAPYSSAQPVSVNNN